MIRIFEIPLYDGSFAEAVASVVAECGKPSVGRARCISATGAHGLVEARSKPAFKNLLNRSVMNLPDGMPVVWLGRLKGAHNMERCYGPDFLRDVLLATANTQVTHFFCGGKGGIARELKSVAESRFGNPHCVGTYSPPFREMSQEEWQELTEAINAAKPDIVWIGLSTPKQERFAHELSRRVNVHFIITVGAAFDIHTGHLHQAPHLLQRMGLEWLFRLVMEPRRLWRRYLKIVPLFLVYAVNDLVRGRRMLHTPPKISDN